MLTLIAAQDRNRAIGRGNAMPWHISEDFAFFRKVTTGHTVIMGRKTWDSLPRRPLPGRRNVVVTRGPAGERDGASFCSLEDSLKIAGEGECVFVIGGAELYAQLIPRADRIMLTLVDLEVEGADAFFPELEPKDWLEGRRILLRDAGPRAEVVELIRVSD